MSDGERAQPFYCPYCGETSVRPGEQARTYHCATCDRRFNLAYLGRPAGAGPEGHDAVDASGSGPAA